MTTHPSLTAGCSQNAAILAILEEAKGEWVAMPLLAIKSGSMAVATRISNLNQRLRLEGREIENRLETVGTSKHSSYRLVSG